MPKILMVEDSPTQAQALKALLEQQGFQVAAAGNGRGALEALRRELPDVVMTDVVMPEMDGYQLCSKIKSEPGLRELPVVILTSLADPIDVIRGLECGANCFLTKPYQEQELFSRLQHVLLNRDLRRAQGAELAIEFVFLGKKYRITSDRMQILDLLITTYETAVEKNRELVKVQGELRALNQRLEEEVQNRTASLRLEMAQRRRVEIERDRFFTLSLDLFCIAGFDGFFKQLNPAWEKTLGFSLEELKANPFLEFVHPEDRERTAEEAERLKQGGQSRDFENRFRRKDGTFRWLLWSLAGEPTEQLYFAVAHDVSERKRLQEQFLQAQKMEAVGQLAGGIAHDFNNLITAITGYSDLVLGSLRAEDPNRADIEEIRKAGQRAAGLTRQILAFSRKQVLQPSLLDLNVVIWDLHKMLARLLGEHIQLAFLPRQGLGLVKADPGQLEQVLMNLAVNARDAMPGGGKLTIETSDIVLDADYARAHPDARPGPHVLLAVTDMGTGMDAATRGHLFEPFFTTKAPGKGTGLGLSTVYGIIKQSGGHLAVYSEPGQGTTFKVYLPRVEDGVHGAARSEEPQGSLRGTETVLVAEDEPTIRKLAVRVLRENGYTVLEASNGEEALRLAGAASGRLDLVLTDLVMPDVGGRELVVRLATLRPGVKSLFMSGYTADSVVRHGVLEQAAAFVPKPFTPEALLRKVRRVLDAADGGKA